MVAVVSTTVQSLPCRPLNLQLSKQPMWDRHLHFHKAVFLTEKIWNKLRFIYCLHISLTSSKFCNVDTFDCRTCRRLPLPPSIPRRQMFFNVYVIFLKWYVLFITKKALHHSHLSHDFPEFHTVQYLGHLFSMGSHVIVLWFPLDHAPKVNTI